jgi:hypothetical protein
MIIIKSTVSTLYINEGVNTPVRGDYSITQDKKWIAFKKKYNLKASDDLFKWYDLYLKLCAAGLL